MKKISENSFVTKSFEETQDLGKEFGRTLRGGEFIALYGNLGSGKTTFVQGLALGIGIKRRIISPTFIIIRSYKIESKMFYHIDLYRIQTATDLNGIGMQDIIKDKNSIIVVEWAEKMEHLLPEKRFDVFFEYLDENKRKIKIIHYG